MCFAGAVACNGDSGLLNAAPNDSDAPLSDADALLDGTPTNDELPEELESERQMLHAHVLMDQGRFDEALAVLQAVCDNATLTLPWQRFYR